MARKRPCRVCRKWFMPHARAGGRQRVCSGDACQRERHRRACDAWRERHPDYDVDRRLRDRVRVAVTAGAALTRDPLAEVAWDVARDAVGAKVAVIVEETGKVLVGWARDAVHAQAAEITRKLGRVLGGGARDEIGAAARAP